MSAALATIPRIKPLDPKISMLWEEDQAELIEKIAQAITQYGTLETIQCLSSGLELHLENTPDFCEEHIKDQKLIVQVLDAVSKFSENLTEDAKTGNGCRQIRRRARDQVLIAIGDIEVI